MLAYGRYIGYSEFDLSPSSLGYCILPRFLSRCVTFLRWRPRPPRLWYQLKLRQLAALQPLQSPWTTRPSLRPLATPQSVTGNIRTSALLQYPLGHIAGRSLNGLHRKQVSMTARMQQKMLTVHRARIACILTFGHLRMLPAASYRSWFGHTEVASQVAANPRTPLRAYSISAPTLYLLPITIDSV